MSPPVAPQRIPARHPDQPVAQPQTPNQSQKTVVHRTEQLRSGIHAQPVQHVGSRPPPETVLRLVDHDVRSPLLEGVRGRQSGETSADYRDPPLFHTPPSCKPYT